MDYAGFGVNSYAIADLGSDNIPLTKNKLALY